MIGKTNGKQKSGSSSEFVNVQLFTNQLEHDDLIGTVFNVSYETYNQNFTWDGSEITLSVPAYVSCTIKFAEVEGYRKPDDVTFITIENNSRTIEAEYKCELLTVNVSADSGSVSGFEVTISKQETVGIATKYTRLEYIQSSGTQYIDTGFKPNSNTRIVIDMEPTSSSTGFLFGSRVNSSANAQSNSFSFVNMSGTSLRSDFGSVESSIDMYPLQRLTIDKNKNVTTINGQSVTATNQSFSSSYNLYLLTVNTAGAVGAYVAAKIYSCKIYDNGSLIRDYIPAKRSDGIAGMYDAINDTFTASSGSSNFIAGREASEIIATQTSVTRTYKIPFNTSYTVKASNVNNYTTPASVTRVASVKSYTVTQEYNVVTARDLSLMDVYGNSINRSTANCYVVREAGKYKFPMAFGNAIKNGQINTASFTNNGGTYSHDFVDGRGNIITEPYLQVSGVSGLRIITSDTNDCISNLTITNEYDCSYINFNINNVPSQGANIIIGYAPMVGFTWSWHIWLWPHDLTPVEITNATGVKYNIMPVNLASKYDSDMVHIKNWFYQWGRHNPMLLPSAWNSTIDHENYGEFAFECRTKASYLSEGIVFPYYFYYSTTYSYSWFGAESYYNLWDAACTGTGNSDNDTVKTVYDPCPVGWKVPNGNTFTGLSIISSANGIVKMARYSGDTVGVDFPLSGYRYYTMGQLDNVGSHSYVWLSSAYSQKEAYRSRFTSSKVYPQDYNYRANGGSVRPVQDDNIQLDVMMISFKIGTTTYQAESGMTWFEWVNSEYNTAGAVISGNYIKIGNKDVTGSNVAIYNNIPGGAQYTLEK